MNDKGKTVAIVAYLTLIGWIIALILNNDQNNKSELGAFHLRQALGILLFTVVTSWIPFLNFVTLIFGVVMWIIGIIGAVNAQQNPVPLLGKWFQQVFSGIG